MRQFIHRAIVVETTYVVAWIITTIVAAVGVLLIAGFGGEMADVSMRYVIQAAPLHVWGVLALAFAVLAGLTLSTRRARWAAPFALYGMAAGFGLVGILSSPNASAGDGPVLVPIVLGMGDHLRRHRRRARWSDRKGSEMSRTITSTTSGMAVGAYAGMSGLGVLHATDLVSSQVMLDRFGEVGTGLWALIAVGGGTLAVAGALIALTSTLRGLKIEGIGIVGLLVSIGGYLAALITAQGLDGPMTTIMLLASLVLGLVLRGVQVIGDIRISRRELDKRGDACGGRP